MVRLSNDGARALLDLMRNAYGSFPSNVERVLVSIQEQLQNPQHSRDVIDTLAEVLAANRGRTVISGGYLRMLNEAILMPSELAKIKALANHAGCNYCGKPINPGEIMTFTEGVFACHDCASPSGATCRKCGKLVTFPASRIAGMVRKSLEGCGTCASGSATAKDPATPDSPVAYETAVARARDIFARDAERQQVRIPARHRVRVASNPTPLSGLGLGLAAAEAGPTGPPPSWSIPASGSGSDVTAAMTVSNGQWISFTEQQRENDELNEALLSTAEDDD